MENMDKIIIGLSKESYRTLKDMARTKSLEERKVYSEIIANLSKAQSDLLDATASVMAEFGPHFDNDEDF